MRAAEVTSPELALIGGTRAALGAGVGLLLADRLSKDQRRSAGWTLMIIGAVTTIPLAFEALGGHRLDLHGLWRGRGASAEGSRALERLGPLERLAGEVTLVRWARTPQFW
jgi:hypothetical protein